MKRSVKEDKGRLLLISGIVNVIGMILSGIIGIFIAVKANNYIILSMFTYILFLMITECYVKKVISKKMIKKLVEHSDISSAVFLIVGVSTIALSWKYFIAFILCIPQAMLYSEYCKFKGTT